MRDRGSLTPLGGNRDHYERLGTIGTGHAILGAADHQVRLGTISRCLTPLKEVQNTCPNACNVPLV